MKTYINGHCIEQVLTNAVELTTAQYNALPAAQKSSGTYIITDAEAPSIEASNVSYDMGGGVTTTVQTAIDNKVSKSGDTMTGNLIVDRQDGTESNLGQSTIVAGNTIPQGTVNNSQGRIFLCAANDKYSTIQTLQNLSANNTIFVPDKTGTICLLESLTTGMLSQSIDVTVGHTEITTIDWTGVDKSKVLYSWVWWSNSLDDVPTFLTPYYNGTYTPAVNVVHHQWKTEQRVNLKICYILKG